MASEKHNEAVGWKNRLEDPDCMPAEAPLDKEAAWDALYTRLRERPARKKTGWYWVAAACLLIALCIPWITGHKKEAGLAKNPVHGRHALPTIVSPVLPVKEDTATDIHSREAERTQLTKTGIQALHKDNVVSPLGDKEGPSLPHTIVPVETTAAAQVTLTAVPDSPLLAQVAVVPKKQLRVVSLNELEPPAEHSTTTRTADRHYLQMKFNSGYAYTGSSQETELPVPRIFKIKLSPPKN